jgi:hypothetical protein
MRNVVPNRMFLANLRSEVGKIFHGKASRWILSVENTDSGKDSERLLLEDLAW